MTIRKIAAIVTTLLVLGTSTAMAAPGGEKGRPEDPGRGNALGRADRLDLYEVEIEDQEDAAALLDQGVDPHETGIAARGLRATVVEATLSGRQAAALQGRGMKVGLVTDTQGRTTAEIAAAESDFGYDVWRSWSEADGIAAQMTALAAEHPDLLELVDVGDTLRGQDILALRLTADVDRVKTGKRPAVLFSSLQHAREWITVEVNERLLRWLVDNYGSDERATRIVEETELWFVLVANPDGYDYTFTDQRLWRKNLRDNNGDGVITTADGVDLNRNLPYKWGYDNEGSSPNPASQTYRGASPGSEPETQAMDQLLADVGFTFQVNWHSAAELLLYGVGWQVATPSPDDHVGIALNGTNEDPGVPGYDPDLSAELYTTNGETTNHSHAVYDTIAFTPELDTCNSAEDLLPDDEIYDGWCGDNGQGQFQFPDSEPTIQAAFEKNLPYALAVAESALDPSNPVSPVGTDVPDFVVDTFDVSHGGGTQTVAVEAKNTYRNLAMHYSIDGGKATKVKPTKWTGGERYGAELDVVYGEYRAEVKGAGVGDEVTVWFTAREVPLGRFGPRPRSVQSEPFTYTVADDPEQVLVVANEDQQGFVPVQSLVDPPWVGVYTDALEANGFSYDVWDVATQGSPHDLAVLSHYDAVVWETGDNRITSEEEDVLTNGFPEVSVNEVQAEVVVAVRDYLNEGGKVFHAGEFARYLGQFESALGGAGDGAILYGVDGDPTAQCQLNLDCYLLSNDFYQYYLGLFQRQNAPGADEVEPTDVPLDGLGPFAIDAAENPSPGEFLVTSNVLPEEDFPQFASWQSAIYADESLAAFEPLSGDWYVGVLHADSLWTRLTTTVDLTGASSGELGFALSYDIEPGYDNIVVEARRVSDDTWTTLPDVNGGTNSTPPTQCSAGFYTSLHPFLLNYITQASPCLSTGATGDWHSFDSASSGGWTDVAFDLSAFAGSQVEVSISYVSDPGSGGVGVFIDDTVVTVDGVVVDSNGFEDGLGSWEIGAPPASSPPPFAEFVRSTGLYEPPGASVTTEDSVTLGFGLEAVVDESTRDTLMAEVMAFLLGG